MPSEGSDGIGVGESAGRSNRTVIPTEVGIQDAGFQSFPIDSRRVGGPDFRLRGNDEFRDCGVVGNDGKWRELCKKCRLKPLEAS
ncbi:TPA: hypothetical protein ACKJ7Y_001805 [Neisseria gonorrhoeae]